MSVSDYKTTAPIAQLGGAKRKNGHKSTCSCHICENIKNKAKRGGYQEDLEKEKLKRMGGSKKKNGHKPDCECPICKNMKNAKTMKNKKPLAAIAPKFVKKGNGHKPNCGCPICKNMNHKKQLGGDDDVPDIVSEPEPQDASVETIATDDEYDIMEGKEISEVAPNVVGGARKNKCHKGNKSNKKSNEHKLNCMRPICKNMKKGGKTRRNKKHSNKK